ncbi:MAG: hypothetical protein IT371_25340 [Deltaproteobacteria bacterium]|nr:hypothetical protein [Deltaproteobacteria bacterium]
MRSLRDGWIGFALLLAIAGCAEVATPVSLTPPTAGYGPNDYPEVLGRWTRNARVLKQLDTALDAHATIFSPDFISAYVARRARIFKLPREQHWRLEQELLAQWRDSIPVVVSAATHDRSWNDFHRKNSVWRIALVNDRNEQVDAKEIRQEPQISATIAELFPYVDRFSQFYWLRFPRVLPDGRPFLAAEARQLTLRFAGPLGLAELTWLLK